MMACMAHTHAAFMHGSTLGFVEHEASVGSEM